MSAIRQIYRVAGNDLEQLTNDHRVVMCRRSRAISAAPWASIRRSRSTTGCSRSRGTTCSCWRRTASMRMSAHAFIAQDDRSDSAGDLDMAAARQHRRGRPTATAATTTSPRRSCGSTSCRTARRASCSGTAAELPLPPLSRSADDVRRLQDHPRGAWQQPQPHLSRGRHRDRHDWSSSRFRRSTCAAIRAYLKRFMMEEWVARAHRQRARPEAAPRSRASATISMSSRNSSTGQTLTQWMIDNPKPEPGDGARHRRADRARPAGLPPAWRCCTRTSGPTTS